MFFFENLCLLEVFSMEGKDDHRAVDLRTHHSAPVTPGL